MSSKQVYKISVLLLGLALVNVSCKKDQAEDPAPATTAGYTVPASYNFANVNYSGQTTRLNMLNELKVYMATGNTQGTVLSSSTLKNMFANSGSPFTDTTLNSSGKQLKNKCFSLDVTYFESLMDSIAQNSTSSVAGSNGVAGVVVSSTNSSKKYLLSATGMEYGQLIEKGLMGAVLYYQAMESYICSAGVGAGVDNANVVAGEGTAMEHHWDEGFGYFGVPTDFPGNTTGVRFWGKYSNDLNSVLANSATTMNAFLHGRAAISNQDYTTRDAKISTIRSEWEKLVAASAIHELNLAKTNFADDALRCHYISEGYAFVLALKYKSDRIISLTDINTIHTNYLGTNYYTITIANIDNAINLISSNYGLDNIKGSL